MSFGLGFYMDQVLNKLGECKDRVSAALRALDNCEVNLKVTTKTSKDDRMSSSRLSRIRNRSKSKCKHSYTHETEKIYKPRHCSYSPDWAYDSESNCGCDECNPCGCETRTGPRGRSPYRLPIYVDGQGSPLQQNVTQQNINVLPGYHGGRDYEHCGNQNRGRGRPIVIVPNRPYGRPQGCHSHQQPQFLMAPVNGYTPVTNDDGKIDIYNNAILMKRFADFADAHAKAKKDKEDADKKKQDDAAEMINKLLKPAESAPRWSWPEEYRRSAEDIRSELERVNADMDQLHSWAALMATDTAVCNQDVLQKDQLAMCSGALQGNEGKENVQHLRREQLKSALSRPKKVQFTDHTGCRMINRVKEVDDTEEEQGGRRYECGCY